jgi:ABC-type nitrate/sulfonate/bicarbonate transport system substrate-binding protein
VTVAYPATTVTMTGFYVAVQEGYTREEGLDAEMVLMNGTASAQGMVARQVDFGMSAGALLAAYVRGAPLRNVFVQIDKPLYYLYTNPDLTSVKDLVGKSMGVEAVGDSTHLAAMAALRAGGVDPGQVTFLNNVSNERAVPGLEAGAVAGAIVSPPFDGAAQRLGYRNLGFLGDYLDYLTAGLATHADTIAQQPELVQAVVRAELKAHRFMQRNRDATIAHMVAFQNVPPEDAAAAYDANLKYLTRDGTSPPETLGRILDLQRQMLASQGATAGPASVEEAFQLQFARQANAELDAAGWAPRS